MTDPRGDRSGPTPEPPISTRWSEEPTPRDQKDALPPPYVPTHRPPEGDSDAGEAEGPAPPFPFEAPDDDRSVAGEDVDQDEPIEDFPFDAFDIESPDEPEGDEGAWEAGSGTAPLPATHALPDYTGEPLPGGAGAGEYAHAGPDGVTEVAFELERIARLLREHGPDAVAAEMSSPDRLTALLAGMVAGYVAGRD